MIQCELSAPLVTRVGEAWSSLTFILESSISVYQKLYKNRIGIDCSDFHSWINNFWIFFLKYKKKKDNSSCWWWIILDDTSRIVLQVVCSMVGHNWAES